MVGYNGNSATYPISLSSIYLQNKIGQNFPEYVDPVSKKMQKHQSILLGLDFLLHQYGLRWIDITI